MFRYWNQLNEDIRILLQRFDAEYGDESEKKGYILLAGLAMYCTGTYRSWNTGT
jgi:hypothetical protein